MVVNTPIEGYTQNESSEKVQSFSKQINGIPQGWTYKIFKKFVSFGLINKSKL